MINIIPENGSETTKQISVAISRSSMSLALLLLLGSTGWFAWCWYQDTRFSRDGTVTTGHVSSSRTQTSSRKGKTYTTLAIDYDYKTQKGEPNKGRDYVKTWKHRPSSSLGSKPANNAALTVEYLNSSPETSRIVIPNRYADDYLFSILGIIAGVGLLVVRTISGLSARRRSQL